MKLFNRANRVAKANLNKLLKKYENTAVVLESAKDELKGKAGKLQLKAEHLYYKASNVSDPKVAGQLIELAQKVDDKPPTKKTVSSGVMM